MEANTKQAYQQKMEAQLKQFLAEANKLSAKVEEATADAKINGQKQLAQLKIKQDLAEKKLSELASVGADKFEELKADVEASWADFKAAFESTKNRLMH